MILFLWCTFVPMRAQLHHLSEAFVLEEEWELNPDNGVFQPQGMVGCMEGDHLYCCLRRSFQNKETGYQGVVCAIDLATGQTSDFFIPMPEKKTNASLARKYWIRSICVKEDKLFLSVQDAILVYQKGKGNRYVFTKRIPCDLPDAVTYDNDHLAVLTRIPEEGRFIFRRQKKHENALDSVRGLLLPAPFMLQYEPNGFVKQTDHALYFLASPELRIEKYSSEGELLAIIRPQLPSWQSMPNELIQKISDMPYGSDRAMYTFFHTKEYSFPLAVHPLGDTVLLLSYHQYEPFEKKEQILTAILHYTKSGEIERAATYTHFFTEDSIIGRDLFPLYCAQRELCLQVTDGKRLIQIVREAPVEWRGKTGRTYADSVNLYFAKEGPKYRVRVAQLRTDGAERICPIRELGLHTYDGKPFTGKEISTSKAIFILNNPPQCHSCEERLLTFINTLDTSNCKVYVVFNNADNYLAKRDQIENTRRFLTTPFTPLFIPTESKDTFLKAARVSEFPAIMLKDEGLADAILLSGTQIYGAERSFNLSQTFVRKIKRFLAPIRDAGE